MEMIVLGQPCVRTSSLSHVMFVGGELNNSQANGRRTANALCALGIVLQCVSWSERLSGNCISTPAR
jgi:hypothetical protein